MLDQHKVLHNSETKGNDEWSAFIFSISECVEPPLATLAAAKYFVVGSCLYLASTISVPEASPT